MDAAGPSGLFWFERAQGGCIRFTGSGLVWRTWDDRPAQFWPLRVGGSTGSISLSLGGIPVLEGSGLGRAWGMGAWA